jgi:hypothetical protein
VAILLLVSAGLLCVGVYAARASAQDGPGATPLLIAGLLALCTMAMAVMSAVAMALLTSAAKARWWIRLMLVTAGLVCPWLLFPLAAYGGDPGESTLTRVVSLSLFVGGVLTLFAVNMTAAARIRQVE